MHSSRILLKSMYIYIYHIARVQTVMIGVVQQESETEYTASTEEILYDILSSE